MKNYIYRAKKGPDEIVEGTMMAENTEAVVDWLDRQGCVATMVEEAPEKTGSIKLRPFRKLLGLSMRERMTFSKQLASLIKSGIDLLRALMILARQTQDTYLRSVIEEIAEKIKQGKPLSVSLSDYPKVFSPFYVAMVKAGEDSGTLAQSLDRIYVYYFKQYQFLNKLRSALAYPILILIVGFGTVLFMFTHVMPRIIPLLINLDVQLPLSTRLLIGIATFFQNNWVWFLLTVCLIVLIGQRALANAAFRRSLSMLKMRLPFFGSLIVKAELARFTRAFEVALRSGIPIIMALDISLPILKEVVLREHLQTCRDALEKGESLSVILEQVGVFPLFSVNIIAIGEESGSLVDALSEVAESFEDECGEFIQIVVNLLEPAMVLIIGLVVGFIVSAVLSPIFQLSFITL